MAKTKKAIQILKNIAKIDCMERGRICKMNNRDHYNHQTWKNGKNIVRYLPRENIQNLQKAIDGYEHFMVLTQKYADEIIRQTKKKMKLNKNSNKNSKIAKKN